MKRWKTCPIVLKRKAVLTILTGACCISVTFLVFLICKDRMLLVLGTAFFLGCLIRSGSLLHTMIYQKYDTVTGVCIGSCSSLLHRYRKIYLVDDSGNETALLLGKQERIKKGALYRFYFQTNSHIPWGSDYLDATLSTHTFLGYEELPQNLLLPPA